MGAAPAVLDAIAADFHGRARHVTVRAALPSLDASVEAEVMDPVNSGVLVVSRRHPAQSLVGVYNITPEPQRLPRWVLPLGNEAFDALTEATPLTDGDLTLEPYQGRWLVQPTSAGINPNNNGSSWDGEGSPPDVFVRMKCPGAAVTETPESESYSPTWTSGGCIAQASALLAEPWVFQVWDSDVSSNDTITSPLGYQFTEEALTAGTVILQASGGMKSLTLQVRKQP